LKQLLRENRSNEMKKLYLSRKDKKIFGVCGGIGEAYDIDPTLVRLVVVFLAFATAILPVLLTYLVAWAIVPKEPTV
jgi:phage shock protein C